MYCALAILAMCISAELSPGTKNFQTGIKAAKELMSGIEGKATKMYEEAKELRRKIQELSPKIEPVTDVQLDEYIGKISKANNILVDVEIHYQSMIKSIKNQTELEIRTLQRALDTGVQERFQKAIKNVQIIMTTILKTGAERLMEMSTKMSTAKDLYTQVFNDSVQYKQKCENEVESGNSKIEKKAKQKRIDAYCGCIASALVPAAIPICYAAAVTAIEVTVAGWWKVHKQLREALEEFAGSFDGMSKRATEMIQISESMYTDITETRDLLQDKEQNMVAADEFDYWQYVILGDDLPHLVEELNKRIR